MFAAVFVGAMAAVIVISSYDIGLLLGLGVYSASGTIFIIALVLLMLKESPIHLRQFDPFE
ncbi:MAG: hypothetical protein P8J02_00435 [Yoonia sp.]|nr:hypothetical protein [Yoonia sp.]